MTGFHCSLAIALQVFAPRSGLNSPSLTCRTSVTDCRLCLRLFSSFKRGTKRGQSLLSNITYEVVLLVSIAIVLVSRELSCRWQVRTPSGGVAVVNILCKLYFPQIQALLRVNVILGQLSFGRKRLVDPSTGRIPLLSLLLLLLRALCVESLHSEALYF